MRGGDRRTSRRGHRKTRSPWGAPTLAAAVSALLVVGSIPALAYVGGGDDPQDAERYDVRSTTRRVERGKDARMLKVSIFTYGDDLSVGSWVLIDVRLDARGGRAAEAVLHIGIFDMSGNGCALQTRSGRVLERGHLKIVEGEAVRCRVPVRRLHPSKAIRWKVITTYGNGEPRYDVAPNRGMYD